MSTFANQVFNAYTQNPVNLNVSLTGLSSSVVLDMGSPWDNAVSAVPASLFTALTGAQRVSLTGSPLFSNQAVYWAKLSSIGMPLSANYLTEAQYKLLSGLYVGQPYLATSYAQITGYFTQLTAISTVGDYFSNVGATEVTSVLYNSVTAAALTALSATATIYLPDTVKLKVSPLYHGQIFGVMFTNRASCLFTVNTALSTAPQTLSAIGFDNRSAESVRRFALEG